MPEMVCTLDTRPSAMAGESVPRMSFAAADVNSGRPVMGRYSWSRAGSFSSNSVACTSAECQLQCDLECKSGEYTFLTTGSTHGLLLSSLYAPTPRLTFCGNVSSLYAAVNLKMLFNHEEKPSVTVRK